MARKAKATKTVNPLHFEDLEPHRFEDLVRRLLYGFRDWKNIEATGRAGSDEGFDVRAWEKDDTVTNVNDEGEEGVHAFEGRLWQVQGKREKTITPAKVRTIIKEGVDGASPPYGYILAAATNISKATYDAFREELRKKGVSEFYFWGKDHLEDQLSLPQNDEILFTFFGISLSPRRRSRTSELKFNINNKNKIIKLIFGSDSLQGQGVPSQKTFLLRDIKAEYYPYSEEYPDFEKHRRWEEDHVVEVTPTGVFFKVRERYAYLDKTKKQWDCSLAIDLTPRKHNIDRANQARLEDLGKKVETFWRHLPHRLQAKLVVYGFVPFEDMLIIDDKGDPEYTDPHIYVDFGSNGPFKYHTANLVQDRTAFQLEKFQRVDFFPSTFPDRVKGAVYDLDKLQLSAEVAKVFEYLRGPATLYLFDDRLEDLTVGSIVRIPKKNQNDREKCAEVTHISRSTVGAVLKEQGRHLESRLQGIAGRKITDKDTVLVYELQEIMLSLQGEDFYYVGNDWGW